MLMQLEEVTKPSQKNSDSTSPISQTDGVQLWRLTIKDHSHSKPCYSHQGHKGTVAGLSLSFLANVCVDDSTIRRTANGNRVHGTASRTERCSPEERTQFAQDHMDESQCCFNNILWAGETEINFFGASDLGWLNLILNFKEKSTHKIHLF